jgi:hypothetical protein
MKNLAQSSTKRWQFGLCCLAALLAGNAIARHWTASRQARIEEVRIDLAAQAVRINDAMRVGAFEDSRQLAATLDQVRRTSRQNIAWIQLRNGNGLVEARAGMRPAATFPMALAQSQLRSRQPVFQVVETHAGWVVVEAFLVRLPTDSRHGAILSVVADESRFGVIEIAERLDGAASSSRRAAGTPSMAQI